MNMYIVVMGTWRHTTFYSDVNLCSSFGKIFSIFCVCTYVCMCVCTYVWAANPFSKTHTIPMNYYYCYHFQQYEFGIKPTFIIALLRPENGLMRKKTITAKHSRVSELVWVWGEFVCGAIPSFKQLVKFRTNFII